MRAAVDDTFATNDDTPAAGLSLYRFSTGHGGLQCESCHGSTHAEFPSSHASDNVQSIQIQGHKGVLADCKSCHATVPSTMDGGPHGMHPIGEWWIKEHHDYVGRCAAALPVLPRQGLPRHGAVARARRRSFATEKFGTKKFFQGSQIGCYACHAGPDSSSTVSNRAAGGEPTPPRRRARRPRSPSHSSRPIPTATRSRCASSRSRRTAPSGSPARTRATIRRHVLRRRDVHVRGVGRLDRLEPRQGHRDRRGRAVRAGLRASRRRLRSDAA